MGRRKICLQVSNLQLQFKVVMILGAPLPLFFFGLFGFAGDLEKVEVLIFCGVCVCVFFLFG